MFIFGRYYNCVPFAGCIMVGRSNMCHSRVKTFEELPLEITSHKTHHVWLTNFHKTQYLSSHSNIDMNFVSNLYLSQQDSQTDSGMVLASDELERFEHKHRGMLKK